MGNPLIPSFDSCIFYPHIVVPSAKYFANIHPNLITIFNCYIKWLAICAVVSWNPWALLFWGSIERYLDCLDGVVARKYNKHSMVGHWLDKGTDLIYRWLSAAAGVYGSVPLLSQDTVAPGCLILVCVALPGIYVWDAYKGNIVHGNTSVQSIAIHIEDNATLLCVLLPFMQGWILSRCVVSPVEI